MVLQSQLEKGNGRLRKPAIDTRHSMIQKNLHIQRPKILELHGSAWLIAVRKRMQEFYSY